MIDTFYVVERYVFLSLYVLYFVAFVTQNYIRVKHSNPPQKLFESHKTQAVNQLTGVLICFWAIACWTDINHVFVPRLAVFNEFAYAAAFASLCAAFVLNCSIAVRVIGGGGRLKSSTTNLNSIHRTLQFGKPTGAWFKISLLLPWISAIIMAVLMRMEDKAWPFTIMVATSCVVIAISTSYLVILRRRITKELDTLRAPSTQPAASEDPVRRGLNEWKRFTQSSVALTVIVYLGSAAYVAELFTAEVLHPVVFINPEDYNFSEAGFNTVSGVILVGFLSSMLWYSWLHVPRTLPRLSNLSAKGAGHSHKHGEATGSGSGSGPSSSSNIGTRSGKTSTSTLKGIKATSDDSQEASTASSGDQASIQLAKRTSV